MTERSDQSDPYIYKILTPSEWEALCREDETKGSALDQADGFIHFSTRAQLSGTLAKYYVNAGELILAELPLRPVESLDLRWEVARNGDLFPHLYAPLSRAMITQHWSLPMNDAGGYALPALTPA